MATRYIVLIALFVHCALAALPPGYDGLSNDGKRDALWSLINARQYSGAYPTDNPGVLSMPQLFVPSFLAARFTTVSDELGDPGRQKLIHTYGATAKVEMRMFANSTYSGVFKANHNSKGLLRLSLAKFDPEAFTPGMALKLFVRNHPSLNIIAMFSLDGQGTNRNFLQNPFWNVIAGPSSLALKILAKAFALSLHLLPGDSTWDRPEKEENLPLYEHACIDSDGNVPAAIRAPYRITFTPNRDLGWSASTPNDFRTHLAQIPVGSVLQTISVQRDVNAHEEIIGQVVTESTFVATPYNDEQLYFQHHAKRWRP
ncbi:uncharacterized protein LOC129596178 [Paramacrobiotus metropolitanus]|uniref:uncharacterized protein LOC129596178 n=1 Tax=Paramacrobiotus metropolitanus TaxID=2943436 RepID=UPI002445C585|nr:uncharacterized protein LOC129596178 [Paramacrobiotus metropolitanus]XP_055349352.1 uncharacterized protein LOC129596178 [Paramacrobiotus metropolitanus]